MQGTCGWCGDRSKQWLFVVMLVFVFVEQMVRWIQDRQKINFSNMRYDDLWCVMTCACPWIRCPPKTSAVGPGMPGSCGSSGKRTQSCFLQRRRGREVWWSWWRMAWILTIARNCHCISAFIFSCIYIDIQLCSLHYQGDIAIWISSLVNAHCNAILFSCIICMHAIIHPHMVAILR